MTRHTFYVPLGAGRVSPTLRLRLALQAEAGAPDIALGQLPPGTYSATVVGVRVHRGDWGHRMGPNRSQWRRVQGL